MRAYLSQRNQRCCKPYHVPKLNHGRTVCGWSGLAPITTRNMSYCPIRTANQKYGIEEREDIALKHEATRRTPPAGGSHLPKQHSFELYQ